MDIFLLFLFWFLYTLSETKQFFFFSSQQTAEKWKAADGPTTYKWNYQSVFREFLKGTSSSHITADTILDNEQNIKQLYI